MYTFEFLYRNVCIGMNINVFFGSGLQFQAPTGGQGSTTEFSKTS